MIVFPLLSYIKELNSLFGDAIICTVSISPEFVYFIFYPLVTVQGTIKTESYIVRTML